ncbi:hypothetical protein EYF80_030055 [Liparis tanakae]|uniref:Uncharacterized protein n=1 Tax=Liparis tanakae TaxID=230148 RepID=A0A4Z2H4D9_9TELE|nr:hypothetical protein EYF80_030055 [Liparis tanakae]
MISPDRHTLPSCVPDAGLRTATSGRQLTKKGTGEWRRRRGPEPTVCQQGANHVQRWTPASSRPLETGGFDLQGDGGKNKAAAASSVQQI